MCLVGVCPTSNGMIINGKAIAEKLKSELREEIRRRKTPPTLVTVMVGENPISEKFLAVKKNFAASVGIPVRDTRYDGEVEEETVIKSIQELSAEKNLGIIVQLPLPPRFDTERILDAVPVFADVDVLSRESVRQFEAGELPILPTVVASFDTVLAERGVVLSGKKTVVIGKGKLVGAPAALWLKRAGASVTVADGTTFDLTSLTKDADIIVCGAGVPGLLKPEMIKEGVIILDAGTSEQGGKMVGDADPRCAEKAALFTPTPGGIGPITVAMVFKNLLKLTEEKQ